MTLLLLQAVMTPIIAAGDTDPVGTPKGSFSVSPTGGANYTVSFNLPDIKTSLVPSLGIAYNSQSGNGMAGWGCNITGISVITRGLRDYYHDGEARGITHTSADALFLDGRRLILDSGAEGTAGAVYLVEGDPFTTVTASSGSHGLYFSVHTSDGLDYEYGNSSSSRQQYYSPQQQATVTNAWYVNSMTNALDDYITFSYQAYSYTLYPYIILYGNSQTGREATVTFTYETRNDTQDYWIENVKGTMDRRLSGVSAKTGNATYRSYELTYNTTGDASGMKFSRLTTVTEKNGSGEALRPITLTWDYLPGTAQSVSTPPLNMTTYDASTFTSFDVNGDGIDDVIHAREDNGKYYVNVYKSGKSGNTVSYTSASCEFNGGFHMDKNLYSGVSGPARVDFDGDGLGDILVTKNTIMSDINYTGFSFEYVYGNQLYSSTTALPWYFEQLNIPYTTKAPLNVFSDFNNDGKTEMFCMAQEGNQGLYYILYYYHFGNNGFLRKGRLFPVPDDPQKLFTGDYNNDGLTDIITFHSSGYTIFWNNGGTDNTLPFDSIHVKNVLNSGIADVRHIHQGDFNGDGLTDFLLNEEADSKYYFALSNGDGTFLKTEACDLDIAGQATAKDDGRFTFLVYDIDRDGRSDLVLVKAVYHNSGFPLYSNVYHRTAVRWLKSTGTALVPFRTLTFDGHEDDALARNLLLGDFTGNGQVELMNNGRDLYTNGTNPSFGGSSSRGTLPAFVDDTRAEYDQNDILTAENDSIRSLKADSLQTGSLTSADIGGGVLRSSPSSFRLYSSTDMTPNSGKVTSVTDGLGNVTTITYKSLSDPSVYTRGTGASYPVADITVPLHVVKSVSSGNGAAGTMTEYYHYGGLKVHNRGRGLMGFTTSTVSNSTLYRTVTSQVTWDNLFFIPSGSRTTTTVGSITSSSEITNTVTSRQDGRNYIACPSTRTDTDRYSNTVETTYTYNNDYRYLTGERTEWSSSMYRQTSYGGHGLYGGRYLPGTVTVTQKHEDDAQPYTKTTAYTYNSYGQPTSVTEFSGTSMAVTKTCGYDNSHRLTSEEVSASGIQSLTTHLVYDTSGNVSRRYTTPASTDISYTYDTWGNVLTETDNTNSSYPLVTTNVYDGWDRLASTTSPDGVTTDITRGWADGTARRYYIQEETEGVPWKLAWYDARGRTVEKRSVGEGSVFISTTTAYNTQGLPSSVTHTKGNLSVTDSYDYDSFGRKTSESSTSGRSVSYGYGDKTVTTTATTSAGDREYVRTYDDWGNIVTSQDPVSSVSYTYKSNGKPATATSEGAVVTMTYDAAGNQLSLSDPDAGTTTYTYDALGRILTQTDARGKVIENSYDALGRITSTDADGEVTAYTYGSTGNGTMRLTGMSNDSTSVAYIYNPYGWVTQETRSIAGESDIVFEYTYDSYGRLSGKTCQPVGTASYIYDQNGCLKQYRINDDTQWTLMEEYGTETVFYTPTMIDREFHDSKGFLSELSLMNMADTVHHMTFTHDGTTGNLISRTGMWPNGEMFSYDTLDRLVSAIGGMPPGMIAYDDNGNIMEKLDVGEYTYDTQRPHAVVAVGNAFGEIPDDTQSVTYNAYGKVSRIEEGDYATEFLYGPDGQRWRTLTYRNDTLIRKVIYAGDYERVTEGDSLRHFYYGEGNALCVRSGSQGNRYYYVCTDNLGSIVKIVDGSGTSVFEATYDAWGRQTITKNDIGFLRGYTGHEMMPEYGLINMNGRLYDPILGRFLSPDNYVQLPDFSQSFNRYSYCLNNPLKYVDPDGEMPWFIPVIGALIGGISNVVANWKDIDGFWQGFTAFIVGAGAGATTVATGGSGASIWTVAGVTAAGGAVTGATNNVIAQTGHNFEGFNQIDWGQVGVAAAASGVAGFAGGAAGYGVANMDFLVNSVNSPILRSVVVSPWAAGAGHIAGGTTANWLIGQSFGDAFSNSFRGIGKSMAIGSALGVVSAIGISYASGINPWNGNPLNGITVTAEDLQIENEVQRIKDGVTYSQYRHDGTEFYNDPARQGYLPQGIQYKEYVVPTYGIRGPGPQRIVVGADGSWYYTPDHYDTFIRFKP